MTDILKLIDEKITEMKPYYERMDKTRDALTKPYIMTNFLDKEIKESKPVTLNTAKWQANTLTNKLLKVKWQTVVEGEGLSKTRIRDLERFSDDIWAQVDEFLSDKQGVSGGVMAYQSRQVIDTGIIGQRIYLYFKAGELVIDVRPIDMRWCPYEQNEWHCPMEVWETVKLNSLLDTWRNGKGYEVLGGYQAEGKRNICKEFWDSKHMEFWVGEKKVAERNNPFGVSPFVVVKPATGHHFRDKEGNTFDAVDALWMDIDLYETENMMATIAQTLLYDAAFPAYEQEKATGEPDAPPTTGETIAVSPGELHKKLEKGEITNAFLKADQQIAQAVQRGGVTDMEAGNSGAPNTNALVVTNNTLTLEKLQPYIDALQSLRAGSMRMVLNQYKGISKVETDYNDIGISGEKHKFSPKQVGDPATYSIRYKALYKTKEMELANRAEFLALYGRLPLKYNLEHVLEVEDADGIMRELEQEKWKEADSTIGMSEGAIRYAEEADELEGADADIKFVAAKNLCEQVVLMRRQRRAAAQAAMNPLPQDVQNPNQEKSKGNAQGLMGLGGPGVGGRPVSQKPLQLTGGQGG